MREALAPGADHVVLPETDEVRGAFSAPLTLLRLETMPPKERHAEPPSEARLKVSSHQPRVSAGFGATASGATQLAERHSPARS